VERAQSRGVRAPGAAAPAGADPGAVDALVALVTVLEAQGKLASGPRGQESAFQKWAARNAPLYWTRGGDMLETQLMNLVWLTALGGQRARVPACVRSRLACDCIVFPCRVVDAVWHRCACPCVPGFEQTGSAMGWSMGLWGGTRASTGSLRPSQGCTRPPVPAVLHASACHFHAPPRRRLLQPTTQPCACPTQTLMRMSHANTHAKVQACTYPCVHDRGICARTQTATRRPWMR
jgi:hypothetical protein